MHISGDHVTVDFDVKGAELGDKTQARCEVLNLLGEKYLELTPKGSGEMQGGDTIPVSRTDGSYDIVATLSELTTTTEDINIPQLAAGADHAGRHRQRRQPAHQVDLQRPLARSPRRSPAATRASSSCSAAPTGSPSCSPSAAVTWSR